MSNVITRTLTEEEMVLIVSAIDFTGTAIHSTVTSTKALPKHEEDRLCHELYLLSNIGRALIICEPITITIVDENDVIRGPGVKPS